ncbi:YolD-like family protein [Neobacillus drentensis]|uniref:YolD-like family protein n=1 Tax=Neobacillus drentensis TaxID=220684 RepID=UPI002FFEC302
MLLASLSHLQSLNTPLSQPIWVDGYTSELTGRIQRVDPTTHELRLEVKPSEYERIQFDDVTAVKVVD